MLEAFDKGGLEGETTRLRSKAKAKNFREVSILGNDVSTNFPRVVEPLRNFKAGPKRLLVRFL